MSPPNEANLIQRIAGGNEIAFDQIYQRYRLRVYGFSYRMTLNQTVAEDITHETFLVLVRNPERFKAERGSLLTYLCAVARNLVMNHLRRKYNGDKGFDEFDNFDIPDRGKSPLATLLDKELAERINDCIAALPSLQREVIILREYEGLSYEDIAKVTEAELGAVKTRLHRARQTLAKNLGEYVAGPREDKCYELL